MTGKTDPPDGAPWWHPDRLAARLPALRARAAITDAVRGYFRARGFVEVDTPALQVSPGLDPHLEAFATELDEPLGGVRAVRYLHASPEFAMKKLVAGGLPRIFQIAHVYRNRERSALHHPEFAMLEWYRAGATWRDLVADCEGLLRACLDAVPAALCRHGALSADPRARWQWLSVAEAFAAYAEIDLLATAPDPLRPDAARLKDEAARIGVRCAAEDGWEDSFFRILLARIEPRLGVGAPTVLYDYPLSLAQLARPSPNDPRLAERFELYVCGVELANAYGELTDPAEQRRRFDADRARRRGRTGNAYPVDPDFLAALETGLPDCAGIALGLDRLVMLATGADDIADVLWAPVAPAGGEAR